jgi:aminoglycoside/choline kinase family phosphotransferase
VSEAAAESPPPPELAALVRRCLGAGVVGVEPLSGGLGTRRFYRLRLDAPPGGLIARVEEPEDPQRRPGGAAPEPPLEPLRSFLASAGIPVPRSYGRDPEQGIDLLEDLGDRTLEDVVADSPAEARRLYAEACDLLPRLQQLRADPSAVPAFGRRLDDALFAYKAERVIRWALPFALGRSARPAEAQNVREAFAFVADEALAAPARLAHRDFKAANLHVHPESGSLVCIDLQGAFLAPPEYDLVCLLRDSHVSLPEDESAHQLQRIRPALPDAPEPELFERRVTLLTLTRVGKDLALYLYAAGERGDERYLRFVPNAVRHLRRAAAHAAPWDARVARLADLLARLPEAACAR